MSSDPVAPVKPWQFGAATCLGQLPGTDPVEAALIVAGELPELPFLAELPDRGVGADPVGRAVGILVDIYAEVVPSGWRITSGASREVSRSKDFLSWDLDAVQEHYAGTSQIKLQIRGPWTLAAQIELANGNRIVTDQGAVRDVAESLAEGLVAHIQQVRTRLPGTDVLLQIDEPALHDVIAGNLRTASGFGTVRAVGRQQAGQLLRDFTERFADMTLIGAGTTLDDASLLREAGCSALALDFTALGAGTAALDFLGEGIESGLVFLAGAIPVTDPGTERGGDRDDRADQSRSEEHRTTARNGAVATDTWAKPITEPMGKLGFSAETVARHIVVTPAGTLAAADPAWARRAMTLSRDVARRLAEPLDFER